MEEGLRFFRAFEVWIYLLLGLVGLYFVRKFVLAWQELRDAGFGLERDNAQARLNQSAVILVLLLMLAVSEFVLVTFVAPTVPGVYELPTPTLSLLSTATLTLSAPTTSAPIGTAPAEGETLEAGAYPAPDEAAVAAGEVPTAAVAAAATIVTGCVPGQIEISSPQNGQEVSGIVAILGSADIPNFGFYKLEMKLPDDLNWLTLQAGNIVIQQGKLGDWDTRRLPPGEYQLGLVVVDNQARLSAPCVVQVRVVRAPEATAEP
jgi:hypothetical protein